MSFNLVGAITSIAPTLATMLGGPLAGTAVTALEGALGLSQGAGIDGITQVVQGNLTPEQIGSIRAADQKHAEIMSQQQIDLQKMNLDYQTAIVNADVADVSSARDANVKGNLQKQLFVLSIFLLTLSIGSEVYLLFNGMPKTVPDIVVGRILGLLDSITLLVLGYYYGSSHGSSIKTEMLNKT